MIKRNLTFACLLAVSCLVAAVSASFEASAEDVPMSTAEGIIGLGCQPEVEPPPNTLDNGSAGSGISAMMVPPSTQNGNTSTSHGQLILFSQTTEEDTSEFVQEEFVNGNETLKNADIAQLNASREQARHEIMMAIFSLIAILAICGFTRRATAFYSTC